MTLVIENVKEEFLPDFVKMAKTANATITQKEGNTIDKKESFDFKALQKEMLEDLKKPQNYAVFERLKDK
ncbi:hypothetical protein ACWIWK_07470 [Helicobacter sp. 23-1048]